MIKFKNIFNLFELFLEIAWNIFNIFYIFPIIDRLFNTRVLINVHIAIKKSKKHI